jgi:DNA polymerase III subunit epsilon
MIFDLNTNIENFPIVAFDTETSGAYPLESEIIELGAVKWQNGQVTDRFQVLLKPKKRLEESNIRIHGITNEMLEEAAAMSAHISSFCDFINDSVLIAHHAPFDLGFLTVAIENENLIFPSNTILCTSLLSRALLTTTNHKLQTLVKELNLDGGAAHRAADDANACLQVFFKCIEKLDVHHQTLANLQKIQGKSLSWLDYQLLKSQDEKIKALSNAALKAEPIDIIYQGGQMGGKPRPIIPYGVVRNPDGDYLNALCLIDQQRKRFYLSKITDF